MEETQSHQLNAVRMRLRFPSFPVLLLLLLLGFCNGCAVLNAPLQLPFCAKEPPALPELFTGYSREHPLPMPSVKQSVDYIDHLRNGDGSEVAWRRVGAEYLPATEEAEVCAHRSRMDRLRAWLGIETKKGTILDRYELTTPRGIVTLWVNPYAGYYPAHPPKGFLLFDDE